MTLFKKNLNLTMFWQFSPLPLTLKKDLNLGDYFLGPRQEKNLPVMLIQFQIGTLETYVDVGQNLKNDPYITIVRKCLQRIKYDILKYQI